MNNLYDIGITDNKLNLINACDNEARVAIKTPVGLTERTPVFKTVAQGDDSFMLSVLNLPKETGRP